MKRIITIGREFGSGGHEIGKLTAEALGIAFYDKELLAAVAKESGFSEWYIEEGGEYATAANSLLFNIAVSSDIINAVAGKATAKNVTSRQPARNGTFPSYSIEVCIT